MANGLLINCPHCQIPQASDCVTNLGKTYPSSGDVFVCRHCSCLGVFEYRDEVFIRKPTIQEYEEFGKDARISTMIGVVSTMGRDVNFNTVTQEIERGTL